MQMIREYHVAVTGNDRAAGSAAEPFATIQRAADVAMPGDTVIVHEGVYREWVDPRMGGISDLERITYRAAEGEKPVIKGSERITNWENVKGTVWKAVVPNSLFGDFNPYDTYLYGDWMIGPAYPTLHLGDVYLNGSSFYEALTLEEVEKAQRRETGLQGTHRGSGRYGVSVVCAGGGGDDFYLGEFPGSGSESGAGRDQCT